MPSFFRDAKHHFISYITGPSHVLLGLAVSKGGSKGQDPLMLRRAAVKGCCCGPIDEAKVREAVVAGIADANQALGTDWHATEIVYIENDSARYSLFEHCAKQLIEHIVCGRMNGRHYD